MRVLLLTYNCGKAPISPTANLFLPVDPTLHDVIVIGLQELAPVINGCFADIGLYLLPVEQTAHDLLSLSHRQVGKYSHGAIALLVYARKSLSIDPTRILFASSGTGYLKSSLKGAVGLHMSIDRQNYTFVCAHLTANEGMVSFRNRDFLEIATNLDFGNGYGLYQPNSHLFFLGDLNYRCVSDPLIGKDLPSRRSHNDENLDTANSDNRDQSVSDNERTAPLESQSLLSDYRKIDELSLEMDAGNAFFGFTEQPISFAPTYKFLPGTSSYDRRRIPSWCDRILFLEYGMLSSSHVAIHDYNSIVDCCSSDHKPVYLDISLPSTPPGLSSSSSSLVSRQLFERDSDSVSVALNPNRSTIKWLGSIADRAIGWSLWFFSTRRGNFSLCIVLILLIASYTLLL